ncbi:MAG TPA: bifunctional pyr operon transcriptional regulator/uracil phosphoribosyltransferase PyrR [Thiotrichales bacterium]|nr:bifunctional pyr operon transcriptional regulator/uracil phosphoribosyltransferase PyrR [Thiotrichales bacterium]
MNDTADLERAVRRMAESLTARLETDGRAEEPLMVGIHTGGVWLAERLHHRLGLQGELGTLDISFYRDDFTRIGINPQVRTSRLPFSVDDRRLILVDDVLHTGRTIRAAMNELFDYGRPAAILLAVLVDRGGRELPICPDVTGLRLDLPPGGHVKLTGPEPLALEILTEGRR